MAFVLTPRNQGKTPASVKPRPGRKPGSGQRAVASQNRFGEFPLRHVATPSPGPLIQTKVKIGQPNDKLEQEADRVADQVMRMPETRTAEKGIASGQKQPFHIQRKCSGCEEELDRKPIENKVLLRTGKSADIAPDITPSIEGQVNALRDGGQPLSQSLRAFFEPRFGHDFSQVRIHAQPNVNNLSSALNARAFTVGSNVAFAAGEYSPGTISGKRLIAHELTHVVQQGSGGANSSRTAPRAGQSPATLQRFSQTACQATACKGSCGDLEGDFKLAKTFIEAAIAAMKQKELSPQTRTAMRWLFYLEDDSKNAYIIKVLEVMREALIRADSNSDVQCEKDCDSAFTETPKNITPGVLQQCTQEIPCTIHLCPPYFFFGPSERATTLLHESGHLAGLPGDIYISDSAFRYMSQESALRNAEHFAMFVRALNGTLKSDLPVSIGAASGIARSGGETGWFVNVMFDATLNRPVTRIFNPKLRLSITGYGVEGSGRDERLEDPSNNTFILSMLAGVHLGRSRGPGGWFGELLAGGGRAFRGGESRTVFTASASLGYHWKQTELSFGASYIRDTTAVKGFENVLLFGASANFNFSDLIGK
ncbi:MAG TPA: DUF4157 domain-containing protein [Blastocatellia bacterium]|nr:DUF4157 domain-containing protein [Blastocatellia bacterium]